MFDLNWVKTDYLTSEVFNLTLWCQIYCMKITKLSRVRQMFAFADIIGWYWPIADISVSAFLLSDMH